jgi:hypothetical protein
MVVVRGLPSSTVVQYCGGWYRFGKCEDTGFTAIAAPLDTEFVRHYVGHQRAAASHDGLERAEPTCEGEVAERAGIEDEYIVDGRV